MICWRSPLEGCRPLLRTILDPPLVNVLPFHPQELVAGIVVVNSKQEVQHQGIYLAMEGVVSLQLSAKSVGLFEAFYNSLKVHITRRMWRVVTCPPGNRQTESRTDMTDNITFQQSGCRKETTVNIRRLSNGVPDSYVMNIILWRMTSTDYL